MDRKMKMVGGIALVLGIISVMFLTGPILAHADEPNSEECFQLKNREMVQTQDGDCIGNCTQFQHCNRQQNNQCGTTRIRNGTMNLQQYQYQNQCQKRTKSQGC